MIRAQVVNRFRLNGTIDPHDPLGATWRITGGDKPFRLTVITVNWGRHYDPGEFKRNVLKVLNRVGDLEYVVLLIQELDEDDSGAEHHVFKKLMEPGTTLVGWPTHEPIAVSPGVKVTRKRVRKLMGSGVEIGAPVGTGPRRYYVSCVTHIHGVKIGYGNQHPHRDLSHPKVQKAREGGVKVARREVGELVDICDLTIHGGDVNDERYPRLHPREKVANEARIDILRYVRA